MTDSKNIIPFNALKLKIADFILAEINLLPASRDKKKIELLDVYLAICPCAKPELGQFSFPSFSLAKILQLNPAVLATALQEKLNTNNHALFKSVIATGPYLNFQLKHPESLKLILEQMNDQLFFQPKFYKKTENIMVEYSQPNTHKEMHVGHMRNVCLGTSIVNLYRYVGQNVSACTYPGDVGTHVAKCLWYFKKNNLTPPSERKGAWLGTIYSKAHLQLDAEKGTDKEEQNRRELTHILKEIHSKQGEYFDLWKTTRQWSLELMQDVYNWVDVKFDHWFFESDVDEDSIKLVKDYLAQGIFKIDDGAVGIDLSSDGLGFCLLLKTDGNGLYATKDLELARLKFKKYNITKSIYIVDVRQSLHFKQVFKTLEKMGFEQAKRSQHLAYEMVELPDGAMSSRKGNIIAIQSLIDQMQQTIKEQYLNKYSTEWSKDEIENSAKTIANAAIKYGMLKIDPGKKIIFDLNEWLKIDGNSGPYLLYSYARAGSILTKANFNLKNKITDWQFTEKAEEDLLAKLWMFNDYAFDATDKNSPSILCHYLYELCQQLNTFYAQCSIMHAKTEESKQTRLILLNMFREVIKQGLALLSIQVIERM